MFIKIQIAFVTTYRLLIFLLFTKKLEYPKLINRIKSNSFNCIKSPSDARFAFLYISFLCRKLKLSNPCFVVSSVLFECSPAGGRIHFAMDPKLKTAHSWFELEGISYTTDRFFKGSAIESIVK